MQLPDQRCGQLTTQSAHESAQPRRAGREQSALRNDIAPRALIVAGPARRLKVEACTLELLPTTSVWVPELPPRFSDFTLTVPVVWVIVTV